MNARTAVARDRRKAIVRIARSMHREHGQVWPNEVAAAAAAAGLKPTRQDVAAALGRLGLYRR
ncbi:hypothetical protein HZZ00_34970 [Streptomyces sp. NEAU-sy36]|uniref:hypothetical protein n=1 Tax=unclassified Streptomyces TaxID=2593676 RepID=UPI0015D63290|nr:MULTISPECIES: hypothetical protein [unclassified Streptomyces]QLJ05714.1 hypothetical protein HZZ00_34970 [Streptomyces sp. NEAU-sy36]